MDDPRKKEKLTAGSNCRVVEVYSWRDFSHRGLECECGLNKCALHT